MQQERVIWRIRWDRGSIWSAYSYRQAQATITNAQRHGQDGTIELCEWARADWPMPKASERVSAREAVAA